MKGNVLKAPLRVAAKAFRRCRTDELLIIMYHRFRADDDRGYALTQSDFKRQIDYIAMHFTVVALEEYLFLPMESRKRIQNPLALTIDDGYRNFFRHAFPVLQRASLPATVYVPVNFIEQGGWMWQDRNKYILTNTKEKSFSLEFKDAVYHFDTATFGDLMNSLERAYALSMNLPLQEREVFSGRLAQAAGVSLPEQPVPEGIWKVLGVTPGAACDGGGAGGGPPDGVWQAESRSAAKAGTRMVEARIGKAPADRARNMTDSSGPAKRPSVALRHEERDERE